MKTILIVEDDRAINMGIAKNLKYEGYSVLSPCGCCNTCGSVTSSGWP